MGLTDRRPESPPTTERLLEELVRSLTEGDARPDVDLYLASGPVIRGRVVAVEQGIATLHLGALTDPSISYVRVDQVIAITVLATSATTRRAPPPAGADVITPVTPLDMDVVEAAMSPPVEALLADAALAVAPPPTIHDDIITPSEVRVVVPSAPPMHLPQPILEAPTYLGTDDMRPRPAPVAPAPRIATPLPEPVKPAAESTFAMRPGAAPRNRTPAPNRVDLMRQANMHAELVSRVLEHRVEIAIGAPLDDDARRAISHALPLASDVLLALVAEHDHRLALEQITTIELVTGDAEVRRPDITRLVIRCSNVDKFTAATLRTAIETAQR